MGNEYEKQKKEKLEELEKLIFDLRTKGKSYEDIGAFANVASSTIYRIAEGETSPRMKTIEKILTSLRNSSEIDLEKKKEGSRSLGFHALDAQKGNIQKDLLEMFGAIQEILSSPDVPNEFKISFFSSLYNLIMSYRALTGKISKNEEQSTKDSD